MTRDLCDLEDEEMRKPVLLKVPGVKMVRIVALTDFLNSEENKPIVDAADRERRNSEVKYVTLLEMKADSYKGSSDPGYGISLKILTEFEVRDAGGHTVMQTPGNVFKEVLSRLGIFH